MKTSKQLLQISTHTPLAGRDRRSRRQSLFENDFYSHAPCGARRTLTVTGAFVDDFYSHAPCGARLADGKTLTVDGKFLLTRPLRGATGWTEVKVTQYHFYSHAPCGARHSTSAGTRADINFYSHAPCGARQFDVRRNASRYQFLLTRPLRGATRIYLTHRSILLNFYSHAPCGARRN